MFETRITRLFNIKYPIICGGMMWLGRAELAAAVANAGGLGFITASTFPTVQELRADIRKARDLTDKPIGLNINLFPSARPQPVEEWVRVAVEEKIEVVESSGRSPEKIVEPLHQGGVKLLHKVAGARFARTAERLGCDAVAVVGFECGGHPGLDTVTTLVMVPLAVDAVKIPVVAGGGFADGRGLAAALALGADAVLMGTRFMATQECRGHQAWKQHLIDAGEGDTNFVMRTLGNPSRVAKNPLTDQVLEMEARGTTIQELLPLIGGKSNVAYDDGNIEEGFAPCGQSVGMIHDVPTVKELIDRMIEEASAARERIDRAIPQAVAR